MASYHWKAGSNLYLLLEYFQKKCEAVLRLEERKNR